MRPTPPSWLKLLVPVKRTVDCTPLSPSVASPLFPSQPISDSTLASTDAVKIRVGPNGVETKGVKHSMVSFANHPLPSEAIVAHLSIDTLLQNPFDEIGELRSLEEV
jgi:hypothetical protein